MKEASDKPTEMPRITHITLDTGHSYLVPADKVRLDVAPELAGLILAGGGPIPKTNGRYRFCVTANNPDCCSFSIWGEAIPVAMCTFQNPSPCARENWEAQFEVDAILPKSMRLRRDVRKPAEPWLAVRLLPAAIMVREDLAWIAEFEQYVAEAWRRLPRSQRAAIQSSDIEEFSARHGVSDSRGPKSGEAPPSESAQLIARLGHLAKRNRDLERMLKELRSANEAMGPKLQSLAGLRHQADCLRDEASSKDARIKALEAELAAVQAEIERRVTEEVGDVRKAAEENEFRALAAEDEAAKALRRAESAEGRSRSLERLLRRNGIEPTMAFADADAVGRAEA